jgi:hypothetical protein
VNAPEQQRDPAREFEQSDDPKSGGSSLTI